MVDGAPTSDPAKEPTRHEELPDRLRVHQLARSLGNTNKEVLDALFQLDGQARNVHSGVDREDALRVRDMLFAKAPAMFPTLDSTAEEPESRPTETATERPHYMPLFVSPQPRQVDEDTEDDAADGDDSDSDDEDDDEQGDRPANRRRRRGRRGRGRGRGEQAGSDGADTDETERKTKDSA